MKKKLTITVDEIVLRQAKGYARRHGVSRSSLIEESLSLLSQTEAQSFSERWRGKFRPANRDDERYARLARKFL